MSISVPVVRRHALGLPPGSIRAAHVIMIVGLVCLILLIPTERVMPIRPYLVYLFFLVLGHFFAAHGVTIARPGADEKSPLYLPPGLVRFLLMAAVAGTIGWCMYNDQERLLAQFTATLDGLKAQPYLPVVLLGSFFVGVVIRAIVGRENPPMWLQDLEAWISLMALLGLGIAVIVNLVVLPTLEEDFPLPTAEMILATLIAFYFGERS